MTEKKIKLFGKFFFTKDLKMSIDDNLFFDLNKVSFISEEMFREESLDNGMFQLSFYFTFIIDGVLFEVLDNFVVNYYGDVQKEISKYYSNIKVFALREFMLRAVFY